MREKLDLEELLHIWERKIYPQLEEYFTTIIKNSIVLNLKTSLIDEKFC